MLSDINPLIEKQRQNELTERLRYGVMVILAALVVLLMIVLYVFGNDVSDTLKGEEKQHQEQTQKITDQTDQIKSLQEETNRGNELILCLLQLQTNQDFSQKAECQQKAAAFTQSQSAAKQPQGPKGDTGAQGPQGKPGQDSQGILPNNIPLIGGLL